MTETILTHFARLAQSLDGHPAIWRKVEETFEPISWADLYRGVCLAASALKRSGVQRDDKIVHVAENRWEWIVADLAIQAVGAVHVPAHAPLSGAQIAWQINDTDARLLIASTAEQVDKLLGQETPALLQTITYDRVELDGREAVGAIAAWANFVEQGDLSHGEQILQATISDSTLDQLATVLYTSGTTGEPKGVMLSNRNLSSNAQAACQVFAQASSDLRLSFLPWSHIFARTCDLNVTIVGGSQLALAGSRDSVIPDCQAIHPTHVNGVPYFFEKVQTQLITAGLADSSSALQSTFGGSMRFLCSGGAPLPVTTFDFYQHNSLPILQGYGLSETSPIISASCESQYRRGSSGLAVPGVEVVCADDGEILTRGPHVMLGYYKQPQATQEIVVDGWLHTGDLGRVDNDGYVFVTGRKKEIIVTSSGKNVSPLLIEHLLHQSPLIEQAVAIGDNRSFLSAIIVVEPDAVRSRLGDRHTLPHDTAIEDLLKTSEASELILEVIGEQLSNLSHHEQVRQVILRSEPFSIASGELTPKLSVRRSVVTQRHQSEIEAIYER